VIVGKKTDRLSAAGINAEHVHGAPILC
jgi:hypothetical protein